MSLRGEAKTAALLAAEAPYREAGLRVAGIDEAGRGPLAGRVAAGCVILPPKPLIVGIADSKTLSAKRREALHAEILRHALFAAVGWAEVEEIQELGILKAVKLAMQRAAQGSGAELFLVDAVQDVGLPGRELPLIRGDASHYSIAAAGILAKVERDREMERLDGEYPGYGFARHKGYGTQEHIMALRRLGPCPIHRSGFIGRLLLKA